MWHVWLRASYCKTEWHKGHQVVLSGSPRGVTCLKQCHRLPGPLASLWSWEFISAEPCSGQIRWSVPHKLSIFRLWPSNWQSTVLTPFINAGISETPKPTESLSWCALGLKGFFIARISFNTGSPGNKGSRIRDTQLYWQVKVSP